MCEQLGIDEKQLQNLIKEGKFAEFNAIVNDAANKISNARDWCTELAEYFFIKLFHQRFSFELPYCQKVIAEGTFSQFKVLFEFEDCALRDRKRLICFMQKICEHKRHDILAHLFARLKTDAVKKSPDFECPCCGKEYKLFVEACKYKNVECALIIFEALLRHNNNVVMNSWVNEAVKHNLFDIVKIMFNYRIRNNRHNHDNDDLLYWAYFNNNIEIANWLLEKGVQHSNSGSIAIELCKHNHLDHFIKLQQQCPIPILNCACPVYACANNNLELLKLIFDKQFVDDFDNPNTNWKLGCLVHAVKNDNFQIIRMLAESIDEQKQEWYQNLKLVEHKICWYINALMRVKNTQQRLDIIRVLRESFHDIKLSPLFATLFIHDACVLGDIEMFEYLFKFKTIARHIQRYVCLSHVFGHEHLFQHLVDKFGLKFADKSKIEDYVAVWRENDKNFMPVYGTKI